MPINCLSEVNFILDILLPEQRMASSLHPTYDLKERQIILVNVLENHTGA